MSDIFRNSLSDVLKEIEVIFFDFDGVIKESLSVKADAYVNLFEDRDPELSKKIRSHHLQNGGLSRSAKIPIYLEWAGIIPDQAVVEYYCGKFAAIVKQGVIQSQWVPGVETFLESKKDSHTLILLSATPQSELEEICEALRLDRFFYSVHGSPHEKSSVIKSYLNSNSVHPKSCVLIGDSSLDFNAANDSGIGFILRKHSLNQDVLVPKDTPVINNFLN